MHTGHQTERTPGWEFVFAVIGALLVVSAIAALLYEAAVAESSPPNVRVEIETIAPVHHGFLVTFRAYNAGGNTAAALLLEGVLRSGAEQVESAETTLNYLPGKSSRRGGLFFKNDPRHFTLVIQPKGFEEP
jgi:uncharacterized protein (TIGR02588 family)